MRDFRGKPINVGDTVVYPGRVGARMWLIEATVVNASSNVDLVVQGVGKTKRSVLTRLDRVVVVPK